MEQALIKTQEQIPETFPIVEDTGTYLFTGMNADEPEAAEDHIIHFKQIITASTEKGIENYLLSKEIAGAHYLFYLKKEDEEGYSLSWKTKEYEYAKTNLDEQDTATLFKTMQAFLNSVYPRVEKEGEFIKGSSSSDNYSSKEVDQCRDEILRSSDNDVTREELIEEYKGAKIFELYEELFGRMFVEEKEWHRPEEIRARDRYYERMFRKYLPNWTIKTAPFEDFIVQPKQHGQKKHTVQNT